MNAYAVDGAAVINGVGACTPLGATSLASYAAFRGGLMAVGETETIGSNGEPLRASRLVHISSTSGRLARMLALLTGALNDLADTTMIDTAERVGVFLGVADPIELQDDELSAFARLLPVVLKQRIGSLTSAPFLFRHGRSAFFYALEAAMAELSRGACDSALVGSVDSMCARDTLIALDAERRLLGTARSQGIIPGEGAGLVLLKSSIASPARRSDDAMGLLLCASSAQEDKPFSGGSANSAQGLSRALRAIREHPATARRRADLMYTCETGERFWADELAMAYLRNLPLMPEPFVRTMAAENFGDAGAAAGSVLLAMGMHALRRLTTVDVSGAPTLLLCGSGDRGHVGACLSQGLPGRPRSLQ